MLERRAVLSVCGVECQLAGGVLNVAGTAAADAIALRYDSASQLVAVIGRDNELVGQFPLAEIDRLVVSGGAGDDRFEVDSSLPVQIDLHGGEGEDLLASSAFTEHTHSHGGGAASLLAQSSIERRELLTAVAAPTLLTGSAAGPALPPTLGPAPVSLGGASSALAAATMVGGHTGHETLLTSIPAELHGSHPLAAAALAGAAFASHAHASGAVSASGSAARGIDRDSDWSAAGTSGDVAKTAAHHSSSSSPSGEVVAKFAPKRCTVRTTAKELARTVNGEKKCDCAKKKAEAAAAAERAAASEQGDKSAAKEKAQPAVPACPRCERLAALADTALAEECVLTPAEDDLHPVASAMAAASMDAASAEAGALAWQGGLHWAGWTLAGLGLLFAAHRSEKRRAEGARDEFPAAVDWLFAR